MPISKSPTIRCRHPPALVFVRQAGLLGAQSRILLRQAARLRFLGLQSRAVSGRMWLTSALGIRFNTLMTFFLRKIRCSSLLYCLPLPVFLRSQLHVIRRRTVGVCFKGRFRLPSMATGRQSTIASWHLTYARPLPFLEEKIARQSMKVYQRFCLELVIGTFLKPFGLSAQR